MLPHGRLEMLEHHPLSHTEIGRLTMPPSGPVWVVSALVGVGAYCHEGASHAGEESSHRCVVSYNLRSRWWMGRGKLSEKLVSFRKHLGISGILGFQRDTSERAQSSSAISWRQMVEGAPGLHWARRRDLESQEAAARFGGQNLQPERMHRGVSEGSFRPRQDFFSWLPTLLGNTPHRFRIAHQDHLQSPCHQYQHGAQASILVPNELSRNSTCIRLRIASLGGRGPRKCGCLIPGINPERTLLDAPPAGGQSPA